jgi:hypothetical protein
MFGSREPSILKEIRKLIYQARDTHGYASGEWHVPAFDCTIHVSIKTTPPVSVGEDNAKK